MNQALAEWEAAHSYVKPSDVETAMQILADAGYNSKNWKCLTSGYEVYWDSQENKMVLYNAATAEIEYPDEYVGTTSINIDAVNGRWQIYNGNYEQAFKYNFTFKSTSGEKSLKGYSLAEANTTTNASAATLTAALGGSTSEAIKSAIGVSSGQVYVNASSTEYSNTYNASNASATSYAKIDSYYVSNNETVQLDNNGELKANTYVISVVPDSNGMVSAEAKKAAGEYVYSLFVQMNVGAADTDATIVVPEGQTIDVSSHEWKSANIFSGYFGPYDANGDQTVEPMIIDGARLTTATGHALTYKMAGDRSKYCCTGFFGAVYGSSDNPTVIENVIFKNMKIDGPGADFVIAENQNNRNCVGVIGAIIPDPNNRDNPVNVTIKNVVVDNSCEISGIGSVGGLVAYIGGEQDYPNLKGSVTIENCKVYAKVSSTDEKYASDQGYSPVGGILGFTCRMQGTVTIKDCISAGDISGYGNIGGIVGNHQLGTLKIQNCSTRDTELNKEVTITALKVTKVSKLFGSLKNADNLNLYIDQSTITNSGYSSSETVVASDNGTRNKFYFNDIEQGNKAAYTVADLVSN